MLIIPAIDLRGGKVVRLFQGKFNRQKIYSSDPVKVAKHWALFRLSVFLCRLSHMVVHRWLEK